MLTEREKALAIREGAQNAASHGYFSARSIGFDTSHNRAVFESGFVRGYDAACTERDARIAELEHQLENEKQHSKYMTKDRDLWMLTASERGHQLAEARKDADRIDWLTGTLFVARWNGVVGSGSRTSWTIPGDWRYTCATMTGNDLRSAIDAAIDASDAVLKGKPA